MTEGAQHTLDHLCVLALRELRLNVHRLSEAEVINRSAVIARARLGLRHPERREEAALSLVRLLAGTELGLVRTLPAHVRRVASP